MAYTPQTPWGRRESDNSSVSQRTPDRQVTPLNHRHLRQHKSIDHPNIAQTVPFARTAIAKHRFHIQYLETGGTFTSFDHSAPETALLENICARFARGSLVKTPKGLSSVEDLSPGDMIMTKDKGAQKLLWIGSCTLPASKGDEDRLPIRIRADALGELRPMQDLVVSANFRLLLNHHGCDTLFGSQETLAPAENLLDSEAVIRIHGDPDRDGGLMFYNLMFADHQIIEVNGLETESYHPGRFGLNVMSLEQQSHMRAILPHLGGDLSGIGDTVRPVLRGFEAEVLKVG